MIAVDPARQTSDPLAPSTAEKAATRLRDRTTRGWCPAHCAIAGLLVVMMLWAAMPIAASRVPSSPGSSDDAPLGGRRGETGSEGAAVLNVDSGTSFPDFQSAIDAASPGDTLRLQVPSLAEGQVQVDKDLTLEGTTGDEVVSMAVDTGEVGDDRAWFLVLPGVDLTVRNLIFDGDGRLVYQAFRHRGSGLFESCTFRDIRYETPGLRYQGTAIVAFGGDVDVVDCRFESIGRIGVLHFGAGITASTVSGSTYVGKGEGDHLDYAFESGAGASVTLADNAVSDCRGIALADGSASAAVFGTTFFGAGTTLDVGSNTLLDSEHGVALGTGGGADTTTATVIFNRLVGNDAGIDNESSSPVPAENNWWGCNAGPGAAGCDGIQGSGGAVDADPWLELAVEVEGGGVVLGGELAVLAPMIFNSDGLDTSGMEHLPDGTPAFFDAGSFGIMMPPDAGTLAGVAESLFVAQSAGVGEVSVTVDNETVLSAPIVVTSVIDVPTLDNLAMLLLTAALLMLGWRRLARGSETR